MIPVSKLRNIIIGRLEDGGVQIVRIDCTEWVEAYPHLTYYRIEVTSPNGLVYIPVTRMEGNVLIWPITQSDTATSGEGMYQVVATGADGEQKTSDHPKLYILPVMPGTAQETPPAPSQPWVDQVLDAAERAEESADKAETASAHSPVISEGGTWLLWDADAGAYVDSGVKAVGRDGQPGKDAPQEAVLYTAQSLSGEQQAQARENIAAAGVARVEAVETALAGKLDNAPNTWPAWTDVEQAAARARMGIGNYELIEEITLTEDVKSVFRTAEPNGESYKFKSIYFVLEIPAGVSHANTWWFIKNGSNILAYPNRGIIDRTSVSYYQCGAIREKGLITGWFDSVNSVSVKEGGVTQIYKNPSIFTDLPITDIEIRASDTFVSGEIFRIFGVRA